VCLTRNGRDAVACHKCFSRWEEIGTGVQTDCMALPWGKGHNIQNLYGRNKLTCTRRREELLPVQFVNNLATRSAYHSSFVSVLEKILQMKRRSILAMRGNERRYRAKNSRYRATDRERWVEEGDRYDRDDSSSSTYSVCSCRDSHRASRRTPTFLCCRLTDMV